MHRILPWNHRHGILRRSMIGRPFLPRARLHLPNGRRFTVIAERVGNGHGYIGSATLNGKALRRAFLRHEEILAGGELRSTQQAEPNRDWPGAGAGAKRPYSMSAD